MMVQGRDESFVAGGIASIESNFTQCFGKSSNGASAGWKAIGLEHGKFTF